MIKQTSLHLKLNSDILERLDKICAVAGVNRNKAINLMVLVLLRRCENELVNSNNESVHFFKAYDFFLKVL